MKDFRFIDEIDRLFDELVHLPWSPQRIAPASRSPGGETQLEFALPVGHRELGDISISLQGRRLRIQVHGGRGAPAPAVVERSFTLPEGATVSAIEAEMADDTLQLRVRLRAA